MATTMLTKFCPRCTEVKDASAFSPRTRRGRTDLAGWCRACSNAQIRERYRRDPEPNRRRVREWQRKNPERLREKTLAWQQANRERYLLGRRVLESRRRAKRRSASGRATVDAVAARIAYYGGRCWMCGGPGETLDHVIPLARGGSNWPANLRPACRSCNSSKKAKMPAELRSAS